MEKERTIEGKKFCETCGKITLHLVLLAHAIAVIKCKDCETIQVKAPS